MERRLSVHAGAHQVSRRLVTAFATVALLSSTVLAAPKKKAARAQFDKGVAAYTKGDFAAAAEALGKSYALEADAETLFAWAQTERKLDRCDKAIELYDKLLAMPKLPEENKDAVRIQIEECRAILQVRPPEPTPDAAPVDAPPDEAPEPTAPAVTDASAEPERAPVSTPKAEGTRAWWKDPVGGALVGLGVVGLGVGTVFLVQGSGADSDKESAATYEEYQALADKAESRGQLGVISLVAGGALVTGGIIYYATRSKPADNTVSGWLAPSGGGLALSGRF